MSNPDETERAAVSLVDEASALREAGRRAEALAVCDEVERRYGASPDSAATVVVVKALLCKGIAFHSAKDFRKALAVSREVQRRYEWRREPEIRDCVSRARGLENRSEIGPVPPSFWRRIFGEEEP